METIEQTIAHQIRDGVVQAHLQLGHDLNHALDLGDAWDGRVQIDVVPAQRATNAAVQHGGSFRQR